MTRRWSRLPAALLAFVALLLVPAAAAAQDRDAPPPELNAVTWALIDARTGETLTAQEPDVRRPVASTTKLMTAYLVFDALKAEIRSSLDAPHRAVLVMKVLGGAG